MDPLEREVNEYSIRALNSAISKTEKGLATIEAKGANTKLIKRRLNALNAGKRALESGNSVSGVDSIESRTEAAEILKDLIPVTVDL